MLTILKLKFVEVNSIYQLFRSSANIYNWQMLAKCLPAMFAKVIQVRQMLTHVGNCSSFLLKRLAVIANSLSLERWKKRGKDVAE